MLERVSDMPRGRRNKNLEEDEKDLEEAHQGNYSSYEPTYGACSLRELSDSNHDTPPTKWESALPYAENGTPDAQNGIGVV